MSDQNSDSPKVASAQAARGAAPASTIMPTSGVGWLALVLTVAGVASLKAVIIMAAATNDPSVIDRRIMGGSIGLVVGAGLVSLLCVSLWRQRSVLNILAAVVCVGALGLVLMLGLGGFFNG